MKILKLAHKPLLHFPCHNLNPPLGAIPRTKVRGFYAPRLEGRVQGMENARFIPRPKGRSFRAFFIKMALDYYKNTIEQKLNSIL